MSATNNLFKALAEAPQNNVVKEAAEAMVRETVREVRAALESGADLNVKNLAGQTPLTLALSKRQPLPVIEMLLEAGADPNEPARKGTLPLILMLPPYDDTVLMALLNAGADPLRREAGHAPPIVAAIEHYAQSAFQAMGEFVDLTSPAWMSVVQEVVQTAQVKHFDYALYWLAERGLLPSGMTYRNTYSKALFEDFTATPVVPLPEPTREADLGL